jgi:hypothetical protein
MSSLKTFETVDTVISKLVLNANSQIMSAVFYGKGIRFIILQMRKMTWRVNLSMS